MKKTIKGMYIVPKSKIPISYLLDYIKEGLTISDFVASYPWLKKKDVERALETQPLGSEAKFKLYSRK